jgi:hypothetical protein
MQIQVYMTPTVQNLKRLAASALNDLIDIWLDLLKTAITSLNCREAWFVA